MADYSLAGNIRHAELFGPECVLETAAADLSPVELGELKAFIESKERNHRWRDGRWQERRDTKPRACERCGLDLPRGVRADARYHSHCGNTARSRKHRDRQRATGYSEQVGESGQRPALPRDTAAPAGAGTA